MSTSSPKIVGPLLEAQNLVSTTEGVASAYSGWAPQPSGDPDLASALIRAFGGMMGSLRDRVNRVPDRNFLAFLNLLGADPTPPRPSRVPLTFYLSGGDAEPTVPRGTRVAATPLPGDPDDVVFETTNDLVATRAELVSVLARQSETDSWRDATAVAAPSGAGYFDAFLGEQPIHRLHLAAESIFGLSAGIPIAVTLTFAKLADLTAWNAMVVSYAYINRAGSFLPLIVTSTSDNPSLTATLTFTLPADIAPAPVNDVTARWIRASLTSWSGQPPPVVTKVIAKAAAPFKLSGIQPAQALHGAEVLDTSMDFFPLGTQPAFNDTFYIQADDVFSRAGASVTVKVTPSQAQLPPGPNDKATLSWEVFDGNSWVQVATTTGVPGTKSGGTVTGGANPFTTTTFTLPATVGLTNVNGQPGYWLRIRVTAGDFGKGTAYLPALDASNNPIKDASNNPLYVLSNDGYRPPVVASVSLSCQYQPQVTVFDAATWSDSAIPDDGDKVSQVLLRYDDLVYSWPKAGTPFMPFVPMGGETAVLLGFSSPFSQAPVTLFVDVEPRSPSAALPPALAPLAQVIWEYWSDNGWTALSAEDDTRSFAESGMVRFMGPSDFASHVALGQDLYWLRARLDGTPDVLPRLGRVLINTVWGTHTVTVEDEDLGSSDLTAGQSFQLTRYPVLEGEQIVVREPTMPPSTEQDAIRTAEGPDAITVEGDDIWVRWHAVPDFYASCPRDRHYQIDRATGTVRFGDGQRGMVPPRGTLNVRAAVYQTGGGAYGDRPVGSAAQLKTTIAFVDSVINHVAGSGGADAESLESVTARGPAVLRHGGRAVTAQDFQDLARLASPRVARARAITPHFDPVAQQDTPVPIADAGTVKLIIIPTSTDPRPTPGQGLLMDVHDYLVSHSAPGVPMRVTGPEWLQVSITDLAVVPVSYDVATSLPSTIAAMLTAYFHPLTGGADGKGWEFGMVPHKSDILGLASKVPGVDSIRSLSFEIRYVAGLRPADYYDLPPSMPDKDPSLYDESVASVKAAERVLISSGKHSVRCVSPEGRG